MPQLNPEPWFFIFSTSWLIILSYPTKILNHTFLSEATPKNKKTSKNTWTWLWQ